MDYILNQPKKQCVSYLAAVNAGAVKFFNIGDDKGRTLFMADIRRLFRIVHGVGQIPDEDGLKPPAQHFLYRESPVQDAHIRMHPRVNSVSLPPYCKVFNLISVITV